MAGGNEDCASVLEQFIQDAANLPAEINYMMEEIQAIDKEMQKYLSSITSKENILQKHVKTNGSMQPHPKEQEYTDFAKKHYDICADLQAKKSLHSEKACSLLDRQLKRLDVKIRELQNDGQLADGPPLPSIFNRKSEGQKSFVDLPPAVLPLQTASTSALNSSAHRTNAQVTPLVRPTQARQISQMAPASVPQQRSSAPATPALVAQVQKQQEREQSAGADSKRRKLNMATTGINLPSQPSGLRQSSLGPGTPKAGTPTGSRAGSLPRTLGQQNAGVKKMGPLKKVPHQQVAKLKNKYKQHTRLSQGARKKGQSPSVRGARAGTAASEEDSVLSSADASDTDASQPRSRRKKKAQPDDRDVEMEDEGDDEEGDEDNTRYCFCNQRSYGEMVACENDDCRYQWFHTGCLKMTKVPEEDEDWFCPECRKKPEIIERIRTQKKKKKDA